MCISSSLTKHWRCISLCLTLTVLVLHTKFLIFPPPSLAQPISSSLPLQHPQIGGDGTQGAVVGHK